MKKYFLLLLFLSSVAFATQSGTVDLGPTIGGGGGGGSGTVTEVDTGSGLTGGPITTSGTISCDVASSSVSGCLSSTDWNSFNNKADVDLSNLTSPTAINQDLIFAEAGQVQILTANSSSAATANINIKSGDGTGQSTGSFNIGAGNSDTQSGGVVQFSGGNVTTATTNNASGGAVSIFGGNTASTNASAEGGTIYLTAGAATTPANAGGVIIYEGNGDAGINIGHNVGVNMLDDAGVQGAQFFSTDRELDSAAGTPIISFLSNLTFSVTSPALIQWQDGSQGTSGQCLVSTDTNGSGSWTTCPGGGGGGANQTLSNLTSPTAVNQNLIFSTGSAAILQTADDSSGSGSLPLTVEAGNDTSTSGIEGGGNLILEAGSTASSTNAGIGGNILMNAGNAAGSGGDVAGGGNVTIRAGSSTVPLSSGSVFLQDGNSLSSITVAPGGGITMTDDTGAQVFSVSHSSGLSMHPTGTSGAGSNTVISDGLNEGTLTLAGDFSLTNTAGTIFNSFNNDSKIDITGQLYFSAYPTDPTISGCGTGASLSSADPNDSTGAITMGTGITTCVLTFANTWTNLPHCFLNDETTVIATGAVPTTTQVTLNGAFVPGDVVDYWCVGEF